MKQSKVYTSLDTCLRAALTASDISAFLKKSTLKTSAGISKFQHDAGTFEKHRLYTRLWIYLLEKNDFTTANIWWNEHETTLRQTMSAGHKGIPTYTALSSDWNIRAYLLEKKLISEKSPMSQWSIESRTPRVESAHEQLERKVRILEREGATNAFDVPNHKNPYIAYIEHHNPQTLEQWVDVLDKTKPNVYGNYPNAETEFEDELRGWAFVRKKMPMPITLLLLRGDYYTAMTLGTSNVAMDSWDLVCAKALLTQKVKIISLRRIKNDANVMDNLRYNPWPYNYRLDSAMLGLAEMVVQALPPDAEIEELYAQLVAMNPANPQQTTLQALPIQENWLTTHE